MSLMISQALLVSSLSFKFSKAANLFEVLILYCFLTSTTFNLLGLNLSTSNHYCLFTYYKSFPNFYNHQIVIRITFSYPERSYIQCTRMPSPVYQYVITLVVSLPIKRGPGVIMKVSMRKNCALTKKTSFLSYL